MRDDLTWGIDLSGSPWPCINLITETGATGLREEPGEVPGPALLSEAGPFLLLPGSDDPSRAVSDWADLRKALRQVHKSVSALLVERTLIGVAYPRSMPPILRRHLPIVLGCDPATDGDGLPARSPLVGLDAPAALILEAVARGAIPATGAYAVGTGRGPHREWTAVSIEKAQPSNPALRSPILRLGMGRTSGSPDSIGLDVGTTRLVAGPDRAGLDRLAPVVELPSTAIASGAARFARWRSLEFAQQRPSTLDRRLQASLLPGTPIVRTETVHPLGLIGDNGRGDWFWRRLFEPGTPLPTGRSTLQSITKPPCHFYLAECLAADDRASRWLAQEEWPGAQLRWHSTYFHSDMNAPPATSTSLLWSLELRDFKDTRRDPTTLREEPPPRWGLPTWITRVEEAVEDEPTEPTTTVSD
jgi:hypothetical protein